jgi:hypothetical protein
MHRFTHEEPGKWCFNALLEYYDLVAEYGKEGNNLLDILDVYD